MEFIIHTCTHTVTDIHALDVHPHEQFFWEYGKFLSVLKICYFHNRFILFSVDTFFISLSLRSR